MSTYITIKLFATLNKLTPENSDAYPIEPGIPVRELLGTLGIPEAEAKLIFIDSKKGGPDSVLQGGERVGIFPPIGGG